MSNDCANGDAQTPALAKRTRVHWERIFFFGAANLLVKVNAAPAAGPFVRRTPPGPAQPGIGSQPAAFFQPPDLPSPHPNVSLTLDTDRGKNGNIEGQETSRK